MSKDVSVDVSYYRVAPKTCSQKNSLAAIAACSQERNQSGIGVRVLLRQKFVEAQHPVFSVLCFHRMSCVLHCSACWRSLLEAAKIRHDVVREVAAKHKVSEWGNSLYRSPTNAVHLQVHRGSVTKRHLRLTARVAREVGEHFRTRGYAVTLMTEDGGRVDL